MRAHCLQHVPFEGLGCIEPWLIAAGYEITYTRFFEPAELPEPGAVDFLVALGGPMSVNDEGEFPWLEPEKRFIRRVIEARTPVLGICLGAQLIANALGARVSRNREKEIGWFPVEATPADGAALFRFPPTTEVFHWHGETFDLPPGAVRLARSAGCENQAFQLGRSALAFQFHLETTPAAARAMIEHGGAELQPARYVQSAAEILAAPPEKYQTINALMAAVLAFLRATKDRGARVV
ncbi:MAG TPA: type 1 glutamine amidotransferase [Opitutaceae bacterium]|nr:type 1 glutamine amidotransferase [Opitutaceae bacterium]